MEKRKVFIRGNFVSFLQFILSFVMFFVLSLQDKTLQSSSISKQPKENVSFNSLNDTIKFRVNISNLALENVYKVEDDYAFFIPEVSVVCECACTTRDEQTCSDKTQTDDRRCAYLINSTTSCTVNHSFGKDTSVCPTYYRMCCQVFFSKNDLMKEFRAVHIKYETSILKLQIDLKSSEGKIKNMNVQILQGITYFQLISDDSMHSIHLTPDRLLSDDWYFLEEGSNELFFSEITNEIDEYNLEKIGWFQSWKNKLSRVPLMDLKQRLRVKPLNCHRPTYEWTLNAIGYYSEEGLSRLRNAKGNVREMYKNSIKEISLNINERMINVEAKRPPTFTTSVTSTVSFPFIFTSNILLLLGKEPVLCLGFTRGDGDIRIEITNHHWENIVSFSMNVVNASADRPVQYSFDLPSTTVELFLVCATQSQQQICQSPIIIKEKIFVKPISNDTVTPVSHFRTDISKNNSTDDYHEKKESSVYRIINIIFSVIALGFLTLSAGTTLCRTMKQKYSKVNVEESIPLNPMETITSPDQGTTVEQVSDSKSEERTILATVNEFHEVTT